MRRTATPKSRVMKNGHMMVTNQTIIPVVMPASTSAVTISSDLTVGNVAAFPTLGNLSKNFDKVKWQKLNLEYVPAVPTTTGGNVALYFDTDRTDAGATSVSSALANARCVITPPWQKIKYRLTKSMLRSNEWFTTLTDPVGAAPAPQTNNTFASPGRIQVYVTPLLGVVFEAPTTIGWIKLDYLVELGFPTGESATAAVPSRRAAVRGRDTSHVVYDSRHVSAWTNFASGCVSPPDFYTFLSLLNERGTPSRELSAPFRPDEQSFNMDHVTQTMSGGCMLPIGGKVVDETTWLKTASAPCPWDFGSRFNSDSSEDSGDEVID